MRAQLFNTKTSEHRIGGAELISAWRDDPDSVLWADYESVGDQEQHEQLEGVFKLHPLALQDALRDRHPPKYEQFEEHAFVRIRGLDHQTGDINFKTIDVSLFLKPQLLVTRRTGHSINTDALWNEVAAEPKRLTVPERLGFELIGRVVRRYVAILLDFEPRLEQLEEEIFTDQGDELLRELTGYKTRLKQLRRIFQYHHLVLTALQSSRTDAAGLDSDLVRHELIDVHDQVQRALSLSELYYELASDLVDAYLALSSHRLNQVMRVLTIVTVIFVPLGLLAGIYGMNFENIPELKSRYGYYTLLGTMALIVATQLIYFKRRGWIWSR